MAPANDIEFARVVQGNVVATALRFVAAAIFFTLLNFSPAFSQSTYSDSWLSGATYAGDNIDYGETNSATISVVSYGVTEGSYTHNYYVETTLRSPDGTTTYRSSGRHVGYARAEISLPWSSSNIGNFITESEHWARCPGDDLNYYLIGSTSLSIPIGASLTCFTFVRVIRNWYDNNGVHDTGLYQITSPCNASCKANTLTYTTSYPDILPTAILSAEPYVGISPYVVCSHVAALHAQPEGAGCNGCVDIDFP